MSKQYTLEQFEDEIFSAKELIDMMCNNDYDVNNEEIIKKLIRSIFYASYVASLNVNNNSSCIRQIDLKVKEMDTFVTGFIKSLTENLK